MWGISPYIYFFFSLLPDFLQLSLSTTHDHADWLLDQSSVAKWAQLLITDLVAALSNAPNDEG